MCVSAACEIAGCKSVRDPVSFVLQKHAGEPLNRTKHSGKKIEICYAPDDRVFPVCEFAENAAIKATDDDVYLADNRQKPGFYDAPRSLRDTSDRRKGSSRSLSLRCCAFVALVLKAASRKMHQW